MGCGIRGCAAGGAKAQNAVMLQYYRSVCGGCPLSNALCFLQIAKVGILGGRVDTRGRRGSRGQGGRQGSRRSRGHGLGAVSSWALPGGASGPAVKAVRLQRGGNLVKI